MEILNYEFIRNALCVLFFASTVCGIIGVWVFFLRMPFISVMISHSAFAGAVYAMIFKINPFLGAVFFSIVSSLFINPISKKASVDKNLSNGIVFSFFLAVTFIGIYILNNINGKAFDVMWGNILLVGKTDVFISFLLVVLVFLFVSVFFRRIEIMFFDREQARFSGINVDLVVNIFLVVLAVFVVLEMKIVGGILIFGLLLIPPYTAYLMSKNVFQMYIYSAFISLLSSYIGFFVSWKCNMPVGPVILLVSFFIFIFVLLAKNFK